MEITRIEELHYNGQNLGTIKARVINKSPMKKWINENGQGFRFYMKLFDSSDKIHCVALYKNYCKFHKMNKKIKNGKVYFISNYILKEIDPEYKSNDQYQIVINDDTIVEKCCNDWNIPSMMEFYFCPIDEVKHEQINDIIDVLGVVVECRDVEYVFVRKFMENRPKKNIFIVDENQPNTRMRVTLWGEQAENFDCSNNTILAIKHARVGIYKQKPELTICFSSLIVKNPNLPEAHKLRQWYNDFYYSSSEEYEDY